MRKQIMVEFTADAEHAQLIETMVMSSTIKYIIDNLGSDAKVQARTLPEVNREFDLRIPDFLNGSIRKTKAGRY